jgi:hypothetical protein
VGRGLASGVCTVLVCAAALAGCGSTGNATRSTSTNALSSRERAENTCGDLRARVDGIAGRVGLRDPQPALFRGDTLALRLRPATREAVSALDETRRALDGLNASPAVLAPLASATSEYHAFARLLSTNTRRSQTSNLRLGEHFEAIGLQAAVSCLRAAS